MAEEEYKRALAHVEKVVDIQPIEGADRIVLATILGWKVVVKKDEFKVGDLAVYVEIDSVLPADDVRFEFLKSKDYRIKTMKLNKFKVFSQGIAFHVNEFPEIKNPAEGMDVTEVLKITKYEPYEPPVKSLSYKEAKNKRMFARHPKFFQSKFGKFVRKHPTLLKIFEHFWGGKNIKPKKFPDWIRRTDEIRCENIANICSYKKPLLVTCKVDGSSTTFALRFKNEKHKKYEIFVCSRNVRMLTETQSCYFETNVYYEMFKKYDVEEFLKATANLLQADFVILQGETYGDKLQGNPYKMDYVDFRGYNLIYGYMEGTKQFKANVNNPLYHRVGDTIQTRINSIKAKEMCEIHDIKWVPILEENFILPDTMEELKQQATGASVINPKVLREGLVYRSITDPEFSFKNVSREYLLSKGE